MEMNLNWGMLGHEWAVDLLQAHVANQCTRHAYLFTGPEGIGRRTLATRLAQALNCTQQVQSVVPCGECRSCRLIEKIQHPDFSLIKAEEPGRTLKVDQIRELQRTITLAPYEARYKTSLILRFEDANPNAANAFLKTLEEPPAHAILLLTASDVETLLPTITSRCELIRLRPLSIDDVSNWLQIQWQLPASQAILLAHISGGRPGYALKLSQNIEILENRQNHLKELQEIISTSQTKRFSYAELISKDKSNLQSTLQTWLTFWRDIMLKAAGSSVPITNIDCEDQILALADQIKLSTVHDIVKKIEKNLERLENYINPRLVTEVLMLDLPFIPNVSRIS